MLQGDERAEVMRALHAFVDGDVGRSIAVLAARGPMIAVDLRGDEPRPAASLLKMALVAAVVDAHEDGTLDLESRVSPSDLPPSRYPSIMNLFSPERRLSVRELCGLVLSTSDNPGAQWLLERVGFERAQGVLDQAGCSRSEFRVGFRDDELGVPGRANVTTAADMVRLVTAIERDDRYKFAIRAMENSMRNFRIPARLPDELRIAHKTGSLHGVANDAGLIRGERRDLVVAVLTDAQPDTARTSLEIGDCIAAVWSALGEAIES
jgi:beta-lactamase class A